MYALICAIAFSSTPTPEPAYFYIEVETNTKIVVLIKGKEIKPNTVYCTQPITENICVEVTVKYVDGGEIKTKTFWMDLEPGYKIKFTLTIYGDLPLVMAC